MRRYLLALAAVLLIGLPAGAQQQPDPADALRNMFEQFCRQSEQFMPGMFSELTPQQMAELERTNIAPREETQFGTQVLRNYEASLRGQNLTLTRQGEDVKYLSALVAQVRPLMNNARRYANIDIAIVNSDSIDAYSIPGGHLIFTAGLMKNLQSEAELVGVIAHELSHLDRGHQLLPLKQAKRANQVSDFRSGMTWVATLAKPFRPEFESQADADAVKWMIAAGYDPRQLAALLSRWDARQAQEAGWTKMIPSFARSHPDSGRRAQVILDLFDRAHVDPQGLIIGRQNFEQRVPASVRRLPD
ncbi:MAG: M48 family metallopeptidase [Aureliella sp.]